MERLCKVPPVGSLKPADSSGSGRTKMKPNEKVTTFSLQYFRFMLLNLNWAQAQSVLPVDYLDTKILHRPFLYMIPPETKPDHQETSSGKKKDLNH